MDNNLITLFQSLNFYPKFIENYYKEYDFTSIQEYLEDVNYLSCITSGFNWSRSKEQHDFWKKIDTDWKLFIKTNDIKYIQSYIYKTKQPPSIF